MPTDTHLDSVIVSIDTVASTLLTQLADMRHSRTDPVVRDRVTRAIRHLEQARRHCVKLREHQLR